MQDDISVENVTGKRYKTAFKILIILFLLSAACFWFGILGNYAIKGFVYDKTRADEIYVLENIADVAVDDQGRIFVFYEKTDGVNAYDAQGNFLWAVFAPSKPNGMSYMKVEDDYLYIYQDDVYQYKCADGSFVTKFERTDDERFPYAFSAAEEEPRSDIQAGDIFYDLYSVYRKNADGTQTTLVHRGSWRIIFAPPVDWSIGFLSGVGAFLTYALSLRKRIKVQNAAQPEKKHGRQVVFTDEKAEKIYKLYRVMVWVNLIYIVLHFSLAKITDGASAMGLLPVGVFFIISGIISSNMIDKLTITQKERSVVKLWQSYAWLSMIGAFLSIMITEAVGI